MKLFFKFREKKCDSCFICYNNCPMQAIYSNKHKLVRYRKPNDKAEALKSFYISKKLLKEKQRLIIQKIKLI